MRTVSPVGQGEADAVGWRAAVSATGRKAARAKNWTLVEACGSALLGKLPGDEEGHFLLGLALQGKGRLADALQAFRRTVDLDETRYDASVELAALEQRLGRHGDAVERLRACEERLGGSPYYLDMAATVYARAGMPLPAWQLWSRADARQPGVATLRARLASASVHVGHFDQARQIYEELLAKDPLHQRNHYELSRLQTATDRRHVEAMLGILEKQQLPPAENIYLYYALGKELEDLGEWQESFSYYQRAGNAAASVSPYDVRADLDVMDAIIDICNGAWLKDECAGARGTNRQTPVFVVGLPRSGTTLAERVLSNHSQVATAGESFFVHATLRRIAGESGPGPMTADILRAAAQRPASSLAEGYMDAIDYRLGDAPYFVEKLPENVLYLGFLARSFPDARFVHVRRHPLDACFAMYKQSFFRFAYTLDDLARYYITYDRLASHWAGVLTDRVVELQYEKLVADAASTIRHLLHRLGLPFEAACLDTDRNPAATNTASAVQVREKIHSRSVGRWKHFEAQLEPLAGKLRSAGVLCPGDSA